MADIRYIKDSTDKIILPVTHEHAVVDSSGNTLATKLSNKLNSVIFNGVSATITGTTAEITATIPSTLSELTGDSTHRVVTDSEKETWDAKQSALTFDSTPTSSSTNPVYSGAVYASLETKENLTNKVTSLSPSSTNTQFPSALCVYNLISGLTAPFGYEVVASLPTASAGTMGNIYLVTGVSDTDLYITTESSGTYSWEQVGTIDMAVTTITSGEIDSLFE